MKNDTVDEDSPEDSKKELIGVQASTESTSVNRRSYLKMAGAAAVGTAAISTTSAAEDHDVIEVGPGETYSARLGDGDSLENVIIDITANGAGYSIKADGDGWAIRNVGVRGLWDHTPSSSPLTVEVPDSNGSALIENVYLPGVEDYQRDDPTGIYVFPSTAGTLEIRNVYIAQCGDNGIYASAPANPDSHPVPGAHGSIQIYDSYITRCRVNVRLSTASSLAENVVSTNPVGGKAAFRDYYGLGVTFRNCDAYSPGNKCFKSGSSTWNGSRDVSCGPGPTLENCRAEGGTIISGPCPVNGSPDSNPRTEPPEGVPLSAKDAASGDASSSNSQQEDTAPIPEDAASIEDVWNNSETNHIVLSGGDDGGAGYQLNGFGKVAIGDGANTSPDDPYRDSTTIEDSEFEIKGHLGGASDDWHVTGAIESVDVNGSVMATINGTEFDPNEIEGVGSWDNNEVDDDTETDDTEEGGQAELTNSIVIDGTVSEDEVVMYSFEVDGEIQKSEGLTSLANDRRPWDTMQSVSSDTEAVGVIGNGSDGYRYFGNITSLEIKGDADVNLNRN